jgi:hypothetical protein
MRLTGTGLLVVAAVLIGAAGATGPAQQSPSNEYLLAPGRAGRIEVGTSVDEVYKIFGRANVNLVAEFQEGMFSPVLKIKLPGSTATPAISVDIREWPCVEFSVQSIEVRDARFRTKDGFGVGSLAGDLRRAHPFKMSEGEEGSHAALVEALQMGFSLTRQGPIDQQRVTSVRIVSDPEAVRKKRCPGR